MDAVNRPAPGLGLTSPARYETAMEISLGLMIQIQVNV